MSKYNPFIWADGDSFEQFRKIHIGLDPETKLDVVMGEIENSPDKKAVFYTLNGAVECWLDDKGYLTILAIDDSVDEDAEYDPLKDFRSII